jgi:hypothetical protein
MSSRNQVNRESAHRIQHFWIRASVTLTCFVIAAQATAGVESGAPDDKPISPQIEKEVIESLAVALTEVYVFPDVAKEMELHIRDLYSGGSYDEIKSTRMFAARLTDDLRAVSDDLHLHVDYLTDEEMGGLVNDTLTDEQRLRNLRMRQRNNFSFKEMEILPGNVGYLRFDGFGDTKDVGRTAIAAMNFLAYTDALIFDLRYNTGGQPSMIQLLMSYLFDDPVELNSFYIRKENTTRQFWTQAYVDGPRMTTADVYVLTSEHTVSAAEGFCYDLQSMKRGTIVGQTTAGGAHPAATRYFLNLNLALTLPYGRAISPITGTNWEGTGVVPDIEASDDQAKDVAYQDALKKILARADDADREMQLNWSIEMIESKLHPPDIDLASLAYYSGEYGNRTITFEDGALYYQREGRPKYRMIPMSKDLFRFDGFDYFRLKVEMNDKGKPIALVGLYSNGFVDRSPRDTSK